MTIVELNQLPRAEQEKQLLKCCGAGRWVEKMMEQAPWKELALMEYYAQKIWWECSEADWLEAFTHHPRIGSKEVLAEKFAATSQWAAREQQGTALASQDVLDALLEANEAYQQKFGFIFIVCATGKSATEMLAILQSRLPNTREEEIKIAAGEQEKITQLRLKALLS
jgi:2-oxo-4-hydroxy-4-carboxy-5-ureidoimidazoline decarboxylase